jgi:hypothetical protein
MRRADRLFDIIQTLRGTAGPLTAAALAETLEVTGVRSTAMSPPCRRAGCRSRAPPASGMSCGAVSIYHR